jgi:hypothetical protein
MKDKTDKTIAALAACCALRRASLQEELYAVNQLAKQLELLASPAKRPVAKEDAINWDQEVLKTLRRSGRPLSKYVIAKRIASRLKLTDQRMTMARVAIALIHGLKKEIKKVKVGKSYQFIAGEEKAGY